MRRQINFFKRGGFLVLAVCLFSSLNAFADGKRNQLLVKQNLSQKLRNDLNSDALQVKLNEVKESKISENEIEISGGATCVLAANGEQMPLEFEAKVDPSNQSVSEIKYEFVESAASYAPNSNEEILMQELMKKIKADYKTENIVIAIDSMENVESAPDEKKFLGFGEVRIGDFVWNRIKFDVVLNGQTQKANKIVYRVEK